ncbi:MAG: hypothetical protein DWQ05_12405 [Calditrichaeota bacterium]|nr:MAG: hypothetical protein DWQ05_12405 [Calditrichota bacterium]
MAKKKNSKKSDQKQGVSKTGAPSIAAHISNWVATHHIFSAFLFYTIIIFIFFSEVVFQGKLFFVPDSQAPAALNAPLWQMLNDEGIHAFWSPYIFGGLPTYGSLIFTPFVYFPYLALTFFDFQSTVLAILHFPFAGLGVYLILRDQKVEYLPAFLGGLAFMLTPHLISMETFGHGSKLMTSVYIPLAFWAMLRLFNRGGLKYIGLAALILGFQFQRGHVQIVYYTWMLLGLFLLFYIGKEIKDGNAAKFYQPLLKFAVVLLLALGMAAILYLPVLEYMPHSIRGAASVFATATNDTGVGIEYATQWSFSPGEMMTFIIPSFYGFGGQTYWGTMPFTDYPHYMGILVFGLALFGLIYRRKQWLVLFLTLEIFFTLLISFGKNLPIVYGLFYDYFPYFNKFRVPVMILILVQFGIVVLAGLGLQSILDLIKEQKNANPVFAKKILYSAIGIGTLLLIFTVGKGVLQGFIQSLYPTQYAPATQQQLNQMRFDLFFKDIWVVGLISGASLFIIYAAFTHKIKMTALCLALCAVAVIDLWLVIGKINNPVSGQRMDDYLQEDQLAKFLKTDNSTFRIFPVNVGFARLNLFGENRWAAQGIQSIGGYHAAKLRAYQDFLDGTQFSNTYLDKYYSVSNTGGQNRLVAVQPHEIIRVAQNNILNFLNVKYVISPYPVPDSHMVDRAQVGINYGGQMLPLRVIENKSALQRAFLVDNYQEFSDPKVLLNALATGKLNPTESVGLYEKPEVAPEADPSAQLELVKYHPHAIEISTQSEKPQLLVLSDPFYPAGWEGHINNKPAKILQANHAFRALVLPAGKNEVTFKVKTPAYSTGKWISTFSFLLVIGLIVVGNLKKEGVEEK